MDLETLRKLMADRESDNLEFKEARASYSILGGGKQTKRSVLGYCSGLGNMGGGYLILGVTDVNPKRIVGSNALGNIESTKSILFQQLGSRVGITELYDEDGKRVVVIKIPKRPIGQTFKFHGRPLMRVGEELLDMDDQTLSDIMGESRPDWSSAICMDATIDDLDPTAISVARANFKIKNPRLAAEVDGWNVPTFLKKSKLSVKGEITNAAILLLGKPEAETLISPAVAQITWILKGEDGVEKDYEHFHPPFILAVDKAYARIRNLKYRYIRSGSLFPEEVDTYDPYIIREGLNNCIAHQDYSLNGRIQIVENEAGVLIFTNKGEFLPGNVRNVVVADSPQEYYRNKLLSSAMVNLNMIDTVGSGIKKMFRLQRDKYFPLPSYDLKNQKVVVKIIGKVLDLQYAKILARNKDLSLEEIILLDRIQKHKKISKDEAAQLRAKKLIEGRYPNIHFSKKMAAHTGEEAEYARNKGLDTAYYKDMIVRFVETYPGSPRVSVNNLLITKLPDKFNLEQKKVKINNLLTILSTVEKRIVNKGNNRNSKWYKVE